jgi:hypothetical protein
MQRPDWDAPTEEEVNNASHTRPGVYILASRVLRNSDGSCLSHAELSELVTIDSYREVERLIVDALRPPTDEDILKANAALKEKLRANAQ